MTSTVLRIISGDRADHAAEITGKKIEDMRLVVSGAGAAAVACTNFYMSLGIKRETLPCSTPAVTSTRAAKV